MQIRLLLIVFAIVGIFFLLRWFMRNSPEAVAQQIRWALIVALIAGLIFLAASGRLHWLFALIGSLVPFARKFISLLRYVPLLRRFAQQYGERKSGSSTAGQRRSQSKTGAMTQDQARKILGVSATATDEDIVAAHRRLMQRVHPDRGGSDYLAAQLNEARDFLLNRT